jgi:molybdopterin synthase catalytic subunit
MIVTERIHTMDINNMIERIKAHPAYKNVGMIASHYGIVRSFSRDGRRVTGLDVHFNDEKIREILDDTRSRPGIVEALIESKRGRLAVGEEFVAVVIAGDTRDHVFPALFDTVNRLKSEAATEKEHIAQ